MVTLLTPTGDRPEAFALLERWVARNAGAWGEWVVVDDGEMPTLCRMGQTVIDVCPRYTGVVSQAHNLLAGLEEVGEGPVLLIEDDDYYAPGYVAEMAAHLETHDLVGQVPARYYNVRSGRCRVMQNDSHASLAQTGVARSGISALRDACEEVLRNRKPGNDFIDLVLWRGFGGERLLYRSGLHIGVKGMPGRKGIGSGHHDGFGAPDRDLRVFDDWGLPQEYLEYWAPPGRETG